MRDQQPISQGLVRGTMLLVTILVAAGTVATSAGADRYELDTVRGNVEIGSGHPPTWRTARAGDWIAPGDVLRTGQRSKVALRAAGRVVRIYENSMLRLPSEREGIELKKGNSLFDVTPQPAAARPFEVETPEVVASVKGTRFYVSLDSGPGTSISVFDGAVELRERADDEAFPVMVRAGFSARGGGGLAMKMWGNELDDPWDSWEASEFSAPALLPSTSLRNHQTLRETVSELEYDDSGIVGREADEAFFENESPASNTDTGGWGTGALDGEDDDSLKGGSSNKGSVNQGSATGNVIGIRTGVVPALDND